MKTVSKKKNQKKWLTIGLLAFSIFCISFLIIVFCKNVFAKDYYKIQPRIEKVKNDTTEFPEESQTVGWIQVQGTNIDFPIIYNPDYEYPQTIEKYAKMFYHEPGFHNNFEVSGHNIFNLSSKPLLDEEDFTRFEQLMNFVYYDFAKENKYIQLTYEGEEYVYKIFMAGFLPLRVAQVYKPYPDLEDNKMEDYLKELKKYNMYRYGVDVTKEDNLLALSTCTRFYGNNNDYKFYVVGRLLRKNEKMNDFSVKKSNNYKEIENILKGDESDEDI